MDVSGKYSLHQGQYVKDNCKKLLSLSVPPDLPDKSSMVYFSVVHLLRTIFNGNVLRLQKLFSDDEKVIEDNNPSITSNDVNDNDKEFFSLSRKTRKKDDK